jgi:hypothetical protein
VPGLSVKFLWSTQPFRFRLYEVLGATLTNSANKFTVHRLAVVHWTYSLAMQPMTQNLRGVSLICVTLCAVAMGAALGCLAKTLLLSGDAEELNRIWRASRFSFFVFLLLFFAMGFILDAVSRRTTGVRKQVLLSKTAKRIAMAVLVSSIAVVCIYPPRPFVYNENGHWISKSKAGAWEVSRDASIDSYKRNITWDCMILLPLAAVLGLVAMGRIQANTSQESQ